MVAQVAGSSLSIARLAGKARLSHGIASLGQLPGLIHGTRFIFRGASNRGLRVSSLRSGRFAHQQWWPAPTPLRDLLSQNLSLNWNARDPFQRPGGRR